MSQRHENCYSKAQDWILWLDTRHLFGPPKQKNILLMLQKIKSRGIPDAPLSAELSAFNLCVKAQDDGYLIPFLFVYCKAGDKPAKCYAHDLHISTPAFYERAHKAAQSIYRGHLDLLDMHRMMRAEISEYV